jgi:hypothetical protein
LTHELAHALQEAAGLPYHERQAEAFARAWWERREVPEALAGLVNRGDAESGIGPHTWCFSPLRTVLAVFTAHGSQDDLVSIARDCNDLKADAGWIPLSGSSGVRLQCHGNPRRASSLSPRLATLRRSIQSLALPQVGRLSAWAFALSSRL